MQSRLIPGRAPTRLAEILFFRASTASMRSAHVLGLQLLLLGSCHGSWEGRAWSPLEQPQGLGGAPRNS